MEAPVEMMTSAVTWTLDEKKIFFLFVAVSFAVSLGSAFHSNGFGGYSHYGVDSYYQSLEDPRTALTNFVAPFLLIAIIFQRGFERALYYTYGDDTPSAFPGKSEEKEKVRRYSLLMSLAVTGMIVPSPYFRIFQDYIAVLFGTLSYLFFGAIFAAFAWVLWKALS